LTKAIILTTQRSGSTFLQQCLQSHPEIYCVGELLIVGLGVRLPDAMNRFRTVSKLTRFALSGAWLPTRLMDRFFAMDEAKAKVFKAMYNHIANPWTQRYLVTHTDIRILHLRRRNLLKQYVSYLLLGKPRVKHWQPHATEPIPAAQIVVSPRAAIEYMRRACEQFPRYEGVFSGHSRLGLVYEEMIDGKSLRAEVADQICDFLQVTRRPMTSKLVKINPERLQEMVKNYEELAAAVRKTEFASLLG
jgi:LPS sulfotransferase NodH